MLRNRRIVLRHEWTPASISGLKLWIDFSDADTLFKDAGSTKVSSDGDAIYQANDKSGNSNNMIRGKSDDLPKYKTNVKNSLSASLFDGYQDYFSVSYNLACTAETIIAVFLYSPTCPAFGRVFTQVTSGGSETSGTHYIPIYKSNANEFASYIGGVRSAHNTNADTWYIYQSIHTGTSLTNYLNETAGSAYSHNLNATWAQQLIGSNPNPGNYFGGYIGEVLCYNSALSGNDLTNIRTYLNSKWNIY